MLRFSQVWGVAFQGTRDSVHQHIGPLIKKSKKKKRQAIDGMADYVPGSIMVLTAHKQSPMSPVWKSGWCRRDGKRFDSERRGRTDLLCSEAHGTGIGRNQKVTF